MRAPACVVVALAALLLAVGEQRCCSQGGASLRPYMDPPQGQQTLTLSADLIDAAGDQALAQGHARLESQGLVLRADAMQADLASGDLSTTGQTTLTQDSRTLVGDALRYNFKSKVGRFERAKATVGLATVQGREILLAADHYTALDGSFTTCPRDPPDYRVTARELVIYPGNRAVIRKASFWVRNHRLFTWPRYTFSLTREQAPNTGLFPKVGFSRRDGAFAGPAYGYAPSRDLVGHAELRLTSHAGVRVVSTLTATRPWGALSLAANVREDIAETSLNPEEPGSGLADVTLDRLPEFSALWKRIGLGSGFGVKGAFTVGRYRETPDAVSASRADLRAIVEAPPLRLGGNASLEGQLLLRPSLYTDGNRRFVWSFTPTLEVKASRALTTRLGYFENHISGESPFRFDRVEIRRGFLTEVDADISRRWATRLAGEYDLTQRTFRDAEVRLTYHGDCLDYSIGWRRLRGMITLGVAFPQNAFGP